MRIRERYELAAELAPRYWAVSRKARGELLDAFSLATGCERKHGLRVLRGRRRRPRPRRTRVGRRMAQPKPDGLLRRQNPVVVGQWRALDRPGFLEIDLDSHSVEPAVGDWIWTLCATDLSTGWTERVPVVGKGERGIVAALEQIRAQLPFPLLGLHPDNGSEFLNWYRVRYWRDTGVALARSHPGHKTDNACRAEDLDPGPAPDRPRAARHLRPAG